MPVPALARLVKGGHPEVAARRFAEKVIAHPPTPFLPSPGECEPLQEAVRPAGWPPQGAGPDGGVKPGEG